MTTLTKKQTIRGRELAVTMTHEDGRPAGKIVQRQARVAGVIAQWDAQPETGNSRLFYSLGAAELYVTAFAAEADYTAQAKEDGYALDGSIFENGTMYGAKKGEAA